MDAVTKELVALAVGGIAILSISFGQSPDCCHFPLSLPLPPPPLPHTQHPTSSPSPASTLSSFFICIARRQCPRPRRPSPGLGSGPRSTPPSPAGQGQAGPGRARVPATPMIPPGRAARTAEAFSSCGRSRLFCNSYFFVTSFTVLITSKYHVGNDDRANN